MKMNGNDVNCKSGISGLSFTVDNVPFSYSVPKTEAIKSGQSLIQSGINAPLNSILSESKDSFTFSFPLQLNGCKYLYFTPVGKRQLYNWHQPFLTLHLQVPISPTTKRIKKGLPQIGLFWNTTKIFRST